MNSVYIYSINTFPVHQQVGQFGTYVIPGRKTDERYSRTEIKPRPFSEDHGNDKFSPKMAPPEGLARDILDLNQDLGLIVSADPRGPTKEELAAAETALTAADEVRVAKADTIYGQTKDRSQVGGDARQACTRLGWLREWHDAGGQSRQLKRCRGCAELILPDAVICKHCNWNQTLDPKAVMATAPAVPAVAKVAVQG